MLQNTTDLLNQLNVTQALYEKFDVDEEQKLDKKVLARALDDVYRRGDKVMLGFVGLHFLLALAFASFYNTWYTALSVGFVALLSFSLAVHYKPRTFFTRAWSGIVLQAYVLLYIFELHGLAEIRFFFFTSFVILIVYQDWKAMWPSMMLFFGQMLVFAYLGNYMSAIPFLTKEYQEFILRLIPREAGTTHIDYRAFWFYVGISCLQVSLTGLWAYFLRLNTLRETRSEQTLLQKQQEIEKSNSELEKNVKIKTLDLVESLENAQATEEELRQNMEELQATQDEIETQRLRLLETQEDMLRVDSELRERQKLMERSQWLETNLSQFDDLMRQYYDKPLQEFSEAIMLRLAELLRATQGAFYIYEETEHCLRMTAGYACTPETVKKNTFRAGEGLIGQLVKTKKLVCMENLPAESTAVESALTTVHSKTLALVPMLYNEDIQGVIEIAVLKGMDDLYLEFLQRLARNVATMLQSIRGIMRTQRLLEQSQEIAKQLQDNALQLERTQEEAEQKANELRSQFEAINHAMVVMEYTVDGHVVSANENFEEISGYKQTDLLGKHHAFFLSERYANSEEYRKVWHKVHNKDFVESEYECIAKNGATFWLHTHSYALGEGRNKKIRVLAHDATKEKEQERRIVEQIKMMQASEELMHQQFETLERLQDEVEQKATQLQQQLSALNLSTALVEYDVKGNVTSANERFYEIMGYDSPELIGKAHLDLVEPRYASSRGYEQLWERLYAKDYVDGEFEFMSKKGQVIWLRGNYYPVTDKKGKLIKIMQLATNITEEIKQDSKTKSHLLDLEILRSHLTERNREMEGLLNAFSHSVATIELTADGEILRINNAFAKRMACLPTEVVGKHHSILVDKAVAGTEEYKNFWKRLNKQETVEMRHTKGVIAYHPLQDHANRVVKVLGILVACK